MNQKQYHVERRKYDVERRKYNKSRGLCTTCGVRSIMPGSEAKCSYCLDRQRKQNREATLGSPWRPGGFGRPPLDRKK